MRFLCSVLHSDNHLRFIPLKKTVRNQRKPDKSKYAKRYKKKQNQKHKSQKSKYKFFDLGLAG